jgi:hypothetical protein
MHRGYGFRTLRTCLQENKTQETFVGRKERTKTFVFPVFLNYEIQVVVAQNVREARQKRNEIYGEHVGDFSALHSHNRIGNALIVFEEKSKDLVCVVHECYHAIRAMMCWANVDDEEASAYHLGYLTQQVYDFVCKKKKLKGDSDDSS